jgi:hypothetical protein
MKGRFRPSPDSRRDLSLLIYAYWQMRDLVDRHTAGKSFSKRTILHAASLDWRCPKEVRQESFFVLSDGGT